MASVGYDGVRVGDVAARAGLSRASFYECWADLEACAFRGLRPLHLGAAQRVLHALDPSLPLDELVDGLLTAYLGPLDEDPVVGRALQVEMDAAGPPARKRRRESLALLGHT